MNFHRVERANLSECFALFANVFNNSPWNENWEQEAVAQRFENCYQTPGFYGLLVKTGNEPIGFALGFIEQWDKSKHFHLKEMCVALEKQGRGVGTTLINALKENLDSQGVEKIYLHTARDTPAQAFYEKQGFYISSSMIMMVKRLDSE